MLIGMKKEKSIIDTLNDSPINFYLTGSRFFGGACEKSDTDFFTQDTPEVRHYLLGLRFNEISYAPMPTKSVIALGDYCDDNISIVYRYRREIDVQLVKDVKKKITAQEMMRELFPLWINLPKGERYRYWNACYNIINNLQY